ncbi:MAG: hypothetical protein HZA22_10150 [Nitrospirae bacterium]|nr:hypothetical protein [Nitrospirota bacterium]MBI5695341.1 hypothetical protein [Nitrospirota bacterium]
MKTGVRLTALFLTVLLLNAFAMHGVAVNTAPAISGGDGNSKLVTFDVCGHGAPVSAGSYIDDFMDDLAIMSLASPAQSHPSSKRVSPKQEPAIALADPREIEKPPEVYPLS